jgi:asparagine synthase (glutamine-hydrolysing)
LPSDLKLRGGEGKYIFKKAFESLLPHDVLYRPKMGFSIPLASWLRGPLRQRMQESVLSERMLAAGYFNAEALRVLVKQHLGTQHDHSTALWMLIMFDAFLRLTQQPVQSAPVAATPAVAVHP